MWSAKSLAGVRKGEALPVTAAAAGPWAALASSAAEVHGLLGILLTVPGTQSPAHPADALCPLPESSAGLLVLLCSRSSGCAEGLEGLMPCGCRV